MYHSEFHGQAPSGLPAFASLAWGSHIGQVFRSAEDLCDMLVPYFVAGLQNNERCLWVTDAPLEADAARAALKRVVPDLDEREHRGDVIIQDGSAFYDRQKPLEPEALVGGLLRMEEDAIAAGYRGVRTNGNCNWVGEDAWDEFCNYEARVQEAIQDRKLICMCSFSHDGFSRQRLADVAQRHDLIVRADAGKRTFKESLNSPTSHSVPADIDEAVRVQTALDATAVQAPSVEDVIATDLLLKRPPRPANFEAEAEALAGLIEMMGESSDKVLQKLADTALLLCDAGSAGISIDESGEGEDIFRWRATAGHYAQYLGGTMPRFLSPCGEVLYRNEPILMIDMVKYYGYVSQLNVPPHEVLLVPFYDNGKAIGTVWVVAHDGSRQFDAEDLRIVRSLTNFTSAAMRISARTRELERANAVAETAIEMREQFIAVLGHDLRNPLGAIVNGAKLLEHGMPAERVGPLGQLIGRSARRIGELVDNLLDFARGRLGGGINVDRQTHQTLEGILDHVVAELRSANPNRFVNTSFAFESPVYADADRIAQMISNLVGNALTHGDPKAPVTVEALSNAEALTISVANKGAPIPQPVIERLFRPFERGGQGSSTEGLGLGLYISSEIAKAHRGELTVESTEAQTVFRFVMPRGES